jgi:dolichol-phosphate mannosyltransferase
LRQERLSNAIGEMKKFVVIPTYNERENVREITRAVLEVDAENQVLIVDDNSPDGTGAMADEMAAADPRVHVLHRAGKEGIGPAYKAGFLKALELGADLVVQMDADFSHPISSLPDLFREIEHADVVLGSRYINGITVVNWPIERLLLSYFGNSYARAITKMPVRDMTGGFKCWRRSALEMIAPIACGRTGTPFRSRCRTACGGKAVGSRSFRSSSRTGRSASRRCRSGSASRLSGSSGG